MFIYLIDSCIVLVIMIAYWLIQVQIQRSLILVDSATQGKCLLLYASAHYAIKIMCIDRLSCLVFYFPGATIIILFHISTLVLMLSSPTGIKGKLVA